jgi:hypothetical protein
MNLVQFRQEFKKIRQRGYALDDEEAVQSARYVSAPILNSDGEPIAAVSISGPVTRMSLNQVAALAEAVGAAARAISSLGFSPPETISPRRSKRVLSSILNQSRFQCFTAARLVLHAFTDRELAKMTDFESLPLRQSLKAENLQ